MTSLEISIHMMFVVCVTYFCWCQMIMFDLWVWTQKLLFQIMHYALKLKSTTIWIKWYLEQSRFQNDGSQSFPAHSGLWSITASLTWNLRYLKMLPEGYKYYSHISSTSIACWKVMQYHSHVWLVRGHMSLGTGSDMIDVLLSAIENYQPLFFRRCYTQVPSEQCRMY